MQASKLAPPCAASLRSVSTCTAGVTVAQLMKSLPRAPTSSESPVSA